MNGISGTAAVHRFMFSALIFKVFLPCDWSTFTIYFIKQEQI